MKALTVHLYDIVSVKSKADLDKDLVLISPYLTL